MKINLKKTLIYTLTTSMLFSSISPALAYTYKDSVADVEYTDVTENGTNNTTVYAEVGSFFKVTIPKHIILNGSTKSGAYTVGVEGDIAGTEVVNVVPDESFALKSNNLKDVTASITQDKTSWGYAEILESNKVIGNGAIDAKDITAGSWNGNFNFNIFLDNTTTSIKVEAKDQNNNNLAASASSISGNNKEILINSLVETGMINSANDVDALIEVKSNEFKNIAHTTFDVSNLYKDGTKVAILHFNEETSEWEYICTDTVENGLINGDFTSFSPVAFVRVNDDNTYENILKESVLMDSAAGGSGAMFTWTNNTGKTVKLNYSIEVTGVTDMSHFAYIILDDVIKTQAWYGKKVTGSFEVANGQTITLAHYILVTSYCKLSYEIL